MRKILTLVSSLLLCIISFAQTVDEVEAMCEDAMISVRLDDFNSAKCQYDSIVLKIKSQITPDEIIPPYIIPIELTEYIIKQLSVNEPDLLENYIKDILLIYDELSYNGVTKDIIDEYSLHIDYLLSLLESESQFKSIWNIGALLVDNHYIDLVIPFYQKQIERNQKLGDQYLIERLELLCSYHAQQYGYYDDLRLYSQDVFQEVVYGKQVCPHISVNIYLGHLITLLEHLYYVSEEYATEKNKNNCIAAIENCLDLHSQEVDHNLLINTYNILANYYCNICQAKSADHYIEKALAIIKNSDLEYLIQTYSIKAQTELLKRNFTYASEIFNKIYEYRITNYDFYDTRYLLHNLRQCAILAKDTDNIYKYTKLLYDQTLKDYLSASWSMKKNNRMFLWMDYSGQRLYYSLNQVAASSFLSDSLASYAYDMALIQKGFQNNYDNIIRDNVYASADQELISSYNQYINAVVNGYEDTSSYEDSLQQNYLAHPEFIDSFKYCTWNEIQENLKCNEVAIEFAEVYPHMDSLNAGVTLLGEESYYIALLLKKEGTPIPIKLCSSEGIQDYIKKEHYLYRQSISSKLYSDIWGKIEPFLNDIETVYFSPHSLLNNINLEVLYDKNGKLFCENYRVKRVSSTSELIERNFASTDYSTASLWGGLFYDDISTHHPTKFKSKTLRKISRSGWKYLEGTLREVDNISKILNRKINVTTFSGNSGTEKEFKNLSIVNPEILHIASHGFYLSEEEVVHIPFYNPENRETLEYIPAMKRSGLLMAGGQNAWLGKGNSPDNDGILTAEEISGMYLENTKLVVLSACQTGLGLTTTEGVTGLQKAFKLAGVQTIIMSLWEVSDIATEILMTNFYKQLNKGKTCQEAFDEAIESVKKWNDNPYYWAAFIMLD